MGRYKNSWRGVGNTRRTYMIVLAVAIVVLDKVVLEASEEVQKPCPDDRENVAGLDFVVCDTVDGCSCSCLLALQDLVWRPYNSCETGTWEAWMIEGLGCC